MLGDPYATVEDFATYLRVTTGTSPGTLSAADTATATYLLAAASRVVEGFTGRQFNKVTVASARRFRAVDPHRLPVDDFHTATGLVVAVDGVAWAAANYDPSPPDGVYQGQTGWPFYELFAVNRIWPGPSRRANISVTAQWGWTAVPKEIAQATLDVAAVAFGSGGAAGVIRSESVGSYSVSYETTGISTPLDLSLAEPYRRVRFGVA